MGDEVKPEVIKNTQESLGKYIKKPPLTEKLLKKPPFRFLHDIVIAVIRETGFLQGVFTAEELQHENIKDRDGKISFLQKLIDAVKSITGTNLTVRPAKIVAGHEPTKTNELLQAIGKALDKKLSSQAYVESLQKKGKKPTKSTTKESKTVTQARGHSQDRVKAKEPDKKKPGTKSSNDATTRTSKSKTETPRARSKKATQPVAVAAPKPVAAQPEEPKEETETDKRPQSARPGNRVSSANVADGDNNEETTPDVKEEPVPAASEPEVAPPASPKSEKLMSAGPRSEKLVSAGPKSEKLVSAGPRSEKLVSAGPRPEKLVSADLKPEEFMSASPKPEKLVSAGQKADSADARSESVIPKTARPRPQTAARPVSARPPSARPAAPRIRDREKSKFQKTSGFSSPVTGKVNVITENESITEQEEEDNFIVVETQNAVVIDESPVVVPSVVDTKPSIGGDHGHLVEQILETQKELENDSRLQNQDRQSKKVEIEWESGRHREREVVSREVDRLRSSIQTLTRAANPLGKLMDFLQEDIDSMQRELETWRRTNSALAAELRAEQEQTQNLTEPLKVHLQQLETSIEDQLNQLSTMKATVLRNDERIQRLLTSHESK